MVKLYTAFTKELDDPERAAAEIIEQLNPSGNMLKNTIGLVHFHYDFGDDDIWREFAEAMPFEVAGCMSAYVGISGQQSDAGVTVTMLTSDSVRFVVRTIDDVDKMSESQIVDALTNLCGEFAAEEKPKMLMPFLPAMMHFSGDSLISTVNALPDPPLLYGMITFSVDNMPETQFVLGNGKMSSTMYAFVAIYGDFTPKFHITTSFSAEEDLGDEATVTDADGAILKSVNGVPALEYLKKRGLLSEDGSIADSTMIWVIPAIVTYPNGTVIARAFLGTVEGTNHILSAGIIENGSKIAFSLLDGEKTLTSALGMIKEISAAKENDIIFFSCMARAWALGSKLLGELEKFIEGMPDYERENGQSIRYGAAYTGGEICPVPDKDGKLVNALHNYTLVACAFN